MDRNVRLKTKLRIDYLIYGAIVSLPAYLLRVSIFGVPTNLWEIYFGIVFLLWAVAGCDNKILKDFFETQKKIIFFAGIMLVGLGSAAIVGNHQLQELGIIKSWFVVPILFWFLIEVAVAEEKRHDLLLAYYCSAFLVALEGLVAYFLGMVTYDGRLAGIYNSPNYLAMYLSPAIIIGCHYFLFKRDRWKMLWLLSLIIIIVNVYLTYSYAAWLALLCALAISLWPRKKTKPVVWLAALLLIGGGLLFSQKGNSKFVNNISFNERSSLSSRFMIWKVAGKLIQENWLLGIGPGNFQEAYLAQQKNFPPYLEWAVPHPHNLFLAFWLSGGLLGLVGFIGLLFVWFGNYFREKKRADLLLVGLGMMLVILLGGLFDTTYFKNDLAVIFWLLFILV